MYQKHKVIQLLDPIVSCLGIHAKENNSKMKKKSIQSKLSQRDLETI